MADINRRNSTAIRWKWILPFRSRSPWVLSPVRKLEGRPLLELIHYCSEMQKLGQEGRQ